VVDVLLPGTERCPSGREVGAHLEWLDVVLAADPARAVEVRHLGEVAAAHESCTIADLERWAGRDLDSVAFALQAAYYMAPPVRAALGYPGQTRRPVSDATPEERWSDALIAPVRDRGPIYVPTPPSD
jgi:hypothetical protein